MLSTHATATVPQDGFGPVTPSARMNRRLLIVAAVIGLHIAGLWALQTGLLRRAVELVVPVQVIADLIELPQPKVEPTPPPPAPQPTPKPQPVVRQTPRPQPTPLPVAVADPAPSDHAPIVPAPVPPAPAEPSPAPPGQLSPPCQPFSHDTSAISRADTLTPAERYQELFVAVQMQRVFPDSKTFVDCAPRRHPEAILEDYRARCASRASTWRPSSMSISACTKCRSRRSSPTPTTAWPSISTGSGRSSPVTLRTTPSTPRCCRCRTITWCRAALHRAVLLGFLFHHARPGRERALRPAAGHGGQLRLITDCP